MKRSRRTACCIFATTLLAICPIFVVAQNGAEPMVALDLQFDKKKAVEITRLRKQIVDLSRAQAALAQAKNRNKAALADVRKKTEETRNSTADLAVGRGGPVAQEMKGRQCLREKPDAECALTWLGRAAAQGRASAVSLLGWMYSTGELVPRDDKRAFAYFMDAAKLGDPAAENNVGQMYETGRGTPANGGEAFASYKRAAEAGLGSAQVNRARSYIEGRGTSLDRAAAIF